MPITPNPMNRNFTEDIRQAPGDERVCYCSGITKADILAACHRGAKSLDDIKEMTGACKEGRCRDTNPRKR